MKTFKNLFLSLSVSLFITSCSSDNESFQSVTEIPKPEEIFTPMESLTEIGAVAILGYPKTIKKFNNGILSYWAQYYFRPDGNILKVNYGHSSSTSEIFSNVYHYDAEGKLVKLVDWDVFDFYWDNGKIIKVEAYNGAWYGRYDLFYDYNDQGQIIQKLIVYYGTTPVSTQKLSYTYFNNGNIKSIEDYGDYNGTGVFELYSITNFSDYIEPRNLFLELEIIPGQSELNQFPGVMSIEYQQQTGFDFYSTYNYKYDTYGRVIEQLYGNNKIVYDYY